MKTSLPFRFSDVGSAYAAGRLGFLLWLLLLWSSSQAAPLGTAFTYQGRLTAGGIPANGLFDLRLTLFNAAIGGIPAGPVLTNDNVAVSNGLFTTTLDFGPGLFMGANYWLEVAVRPADPQATFGLPLLPRQPIIAAPYALYAPNSGSASNAATAVTATTANSATTAQSVPWSGLIGKPPGFEDDIDNDTTYSAGPGLQLNATEFRVNFGGNGLLNSAARSDHTHDAVDIVAGVLPDARLAGTYGQVLNLPNPANTISGNGAALTALNADEVTSGVLGAARIDSLITRDTEVMPIVLAGGGPNSGLNADLLDGLHARAFWQLGGNTNTIPGQDFVGTADHTALEFKVNGGRALRLEPATNGPNLIVGASVNSIDNHVSGASISGGSNNIVRADYAVIAGGRNNDVLGGASHAAIPGGHGARATSYGQWTHASGSFVGPGDAQESAYVLRGTSTSSTATELFLDGSSARLVVPTSGIWTFDILVVASALNNQSAGFSARGVIKRNGPTTELVGTALPIAATVIARDNALWNVEVVADDTVEALVIRVTGAPAQTVRWVATVRTAELLF